MLRNERDYENRLNGQQFSRTYDGFNPKIGVLWQPRPEVQVFSNLSRSQDVPDFSDQLQTVNNRPLWVPLDSQRAWTVEVGTRGRFERYGWDLTLFRSSLRDQLLQFTVNPSTPANTFNAGNTVNQGVEFAGRYDVFQGLAAAGDRLTLGQTSLIYAGTLAEEPDRAGDGFGFGPGLVVHGDDLAKAGLITIGSLYTSELRIRLAPGTSLAAAKARLAPVAAAPPVTWTAVILPPMH
jgi:outer membrane receptor protein involved in Fe transport